MGRQLHHFALLVTLSVSVKSETELPLCPVNVQYFPQNLPMHCRMPPGGPVPVLPPSVISATFPPDFKSPPPDKMPQPIPFPVPPGFPAPIFPPPPIPMVPGPPPPQKLPVIVMPFYSPDPAFSKDKKDAHHHHVTTRRPRYRRPRDYGRFSSRDTDTTDTDTDSCSDESSDTDTDTDTSSSSSGDSDGYWRFRRNMRRRSNLPKHRKNFPRGRKHRHRRMRAKPRHSNPQQSELLTPLIQYVTKDGYVIYEKEISKNEAKDWLDVGKDNDGTKISFQELDELNKRYPGDGTGEAEILTAADLEKSKLDLDKEVKKVEQEIIQEEDQENKTEKPKLKKWRKKAPKSRKEKFAEKIGTNVEALS